MWRQSPHDRTAGGGRCVKVRTSNAPWEIRRTDLDAEAIRKIIGRLQRTGKLVLQGGCAEDQLALFTDNQGDDNARHHELWFCVSADPQVCSTAVSPMRAPRGLGS